MAYSGTWPEKYKRLLVSRDDYGKGVCDRWSPWYVAKKVQSFSDIWSKITVLGLLVVFFFTAQLCVDKG